MKVLEDWEAKWIIQNGTFWNIPESSRLSDSLPLPKCTALKLFFPNRKEKQNLSEYILFKLKEKELK